METRYPDSENKQSIEDGKKFEDLIQMAFLVEFGWPIHIFKSKYYQFTLGESPNGIECKYDSWLQKSNRLSIEIAEKTKVSTGWVKAGIYGTKEYFYIQGNFKIGYWFKTQTLKEYDEKNNPETIIKHGTVKTFYINRDEIYEKDLAVYVFNLAYVEIHYSDLMDRWGKYKPGNM